MKVSRGILFFLIPVALLQLNRCATPGSVDSPQKNYFVKFYGDDGAHTGADMVVNTDGTMVLFGTITKPDKKTLLYLVKVDAFGNLLGKPAILGDSTLDHEARDIELIPNGNGDLVILANVFTGPSNRDILLMILGPDLSVKVQNVQPFITAAGTDADDDATSVSRTNDGFIVAGSTGQMKVGGPIREGLFVRYLVNDLNNPTTLQIASFPVWVGNPSSAGGAPSGGAGTENVTTRIVQLTDGSFYGFGYSKWADDSGGGSGTPDFNFWYFALSNGGSIGVGSTGGASSLGTPGTDEKLFSVATPWPQGYDSTFFLGGLTTDLSGNNDVYVAKLGGKLAFDNSADIINISPKAFGYQLLKPGKEWVSACHATGSYLILTNENSTGNNNLLLTKINDNDGIVPWSIPLIYGGIGDDFAGSVSELPDGKITIMGTMAIGQKDGETKMTLIKVNKDGKFAD